MLPYSRAVRAMAEGHSVTNPFTGRALVNFVLAGTVWVVTFHHHRLALEGDRRRGL
jgi:hypothetical protein